MTSEPPFLGQNCVTPYPAGEVVKRLVWQIVQATLFRWSPRPWHRWRAFLLRCFGAQIEKPGQVVVFPSVRVLFPWRLTLEPRTMIGRHVTIYNVAPIRLEYGANVSQNGHLCSGTHDFQRWSMPLVGRPITIGRNTWLGADVFVGPGVSIGELSVIGARAVVVKDFPARMIGAGNPCRPLKPRPDPL